MESMGENGYLSIQHSLFSAIRRSKLTDLTILLSELPADSAQALLNTAETILGLTPLQYAIMHNASIETISALVELGARPEGAINEKPLGRAAIEHRRDGPISLKKLSPLLLAAHFVNVDHIRYLLAQRNVSAIAQGPTGKTVLHYVCENCHPDSGEALEIFFHSDKRVLSFLNDANNVDRATPLVLAVQAGNSCAVQLLLEQGADLSVRDSFQKTPYELAVAKEAGEICEIIEAAVLGRHARYNPPHNRAFTETLAAIHESDSRRLVLITEYQRRGWLGGFVPDRKTPFVQHMHMAYASLAEVGCGSGWQWSSDWRTGHEENGWQYHSCSNEELLVLKQGWTKRAPFLLPSVRKRRLIRSCEPNMSKAALPEYLIPAHRIIQRAEDLLSRADPPVRDASSLYEEGLSMLKLIIDSNPFWSEGWFIRLGAQSEACRVDAAAFMQRALSRAEALKAMLASNDGSAGSEAGPSHHETSNTGAEHDCPLLLPAIWCPDSSAAACSACHACFTLWNRRHHCRWCGRLFCASCSANRIRLADGSSGGLLKRVCDGCFDGLLAGDAVIRRRGQRGKETTIIGETVKSPLAVRGRGFIESPEKHVLATVFPFFSFSSDWPEGLTVCPVCSCTLGRLSPISAQNHVDACLTNPAKRPALMVGDRYSSITGSFCQHA